MSYVVKFINFGLAHVQPNLSFKSTIELLPQSCPSYAIRVN